MTKTLNSPMFELNQECKYYKTIKEVKDNWPRINEILKEIAETHGFDSKEFAYYGSRGFGFLEYSDASEKFKSELVKNADRNDVIKVRKTSKLYKSISPKMLEIENIKRQVDPFGLHDIFGMNNLVASQWIDDRYFVEVKDENQTIKEINSRKEKGGLEPIMHIDYKDYLLLVTETLKEKQKQK